MCNFPSWIVDKDKKIWFLTDKDVEAYHEHNKPGEEIKWYDFAGHHGINKIYGVDGKHEEGYNNIPDEIINATNSGKMNKIMKAGGVKEFKYNKKDNTLYLHYLHGNKCWFKNGKLHKIGAPAMEGPEGAKCWFKNGNIHRSNGPAVEYANGTKEYWVKGIRKLKTKE